MEFNEAKNKIKDIVSEWYLRMESMSFLMIVHKELNIYRNVYSYQFPKGMLKILADNMERHPNIQQ